MNGGRIVGALVAVSMLLGGGFLALAGLGYVGESADTSAAWAVVDSLVAGLGLAFGFTLIRGPR